MPITGSMTAGDVLQIIDEITMQAVQRVKNAARVVTTEFMDRTPVWSGDTVRNYQWGIGGIVGGYQEPIGGPGYVPGGGHVAQRKGDPGPTNSMPLGIEPRRNDNEVAARGDMEGVLDGYTELANLYLTNFGPDWDLVDSGSAPTPERSRAPGGVSVLAEQSARDALGDDFK